MADKDIGHQARLPGELDGVGFDIFALKEPEYTMMLIYLWAAGGQQRTKRKHEMFGVDG